jgi:TPR repeat protein
MKKTIITLCALLLTFSFVSNATSNEEILDIPTYNAQLKSALQLYKESDFEKALPELLVFAKRGDKMSQYIVGTMYLNSQGSEQDLLKSYAWLMVANEQRSDEWAAPLNMLNNKLPAEFLAQANSEAQHYIEDYGVTAQQLKCRRTKTLGSRIKTHICKKSEVKKGYYFVSNPTYLVSN